MIGRPNAQNKARKGVLRQSLGGAKRKPAQTQNSFSRARPNAQAALKPPNNSAARGGPKRRTPQTILSATAARRPRWRRGEFANALFSPTTSRSRFSSRTRCGAAPTPPPPPSVPSPIPQRARRIAPCPQKPELRIGRRADWAARRRERSDAGLARERCPNHSIRPHPRPHPRPYFSAAARPSQVKAAARRTAGANKKRMKGLAPKRRASPNS